MLKLLFTNMQNNATDTFTSKLGFPFKNQKSGVQKSKIRRSKQLTKFRDSGRVQPRILVENNWTYNRSE